MIDGSFMLRRSQRVRFCEYPVSVTDLGFAVELYLQFLKSFDRCCLGLHEHHSFALFTAYFAGSLHIHKFLGRHQGSLAEDSFKHHSFGTVIDHEGFDDTFFSYKHSSEVEGKGLVVLVIDDVARVFDRGRMNIDRIFYENRL